MQDEEPCTSSGLFVDHLLTGHSLGPVDHQVFVKRFDHFSDFSVQLVSLCLKVFVDLVSSDWHAGYGIGTHCAFHYDKKCRC